MQESIMNYIVYYSIYQCWNNFQRCISFYTWLIYHNDITYAYVTIAEDPEIYNTCIQYYRVIHVN